MEISKHYFGEKEGQTVTRYTMKNDQGFQVSCLDYGCIITDIVTADKNGRLENVVLGFDTLEEYEKNSFYFGAVAGRFAGRIREGKFSIGGKRYQVSRNAMGQHLHGGERGFNAVIWQPEVNEEDGMASIEFSYRSPDGEEGYPGNLDMKVRYTVSDGNNGLTISYTAVSDQETLLNVTNHSYFNLSGNLKRTILDHELTLASKEFLELDQDLLPTGNVVPVDGTLFDFRNGRTIRPATLSEEEQHKLAGNGYDHPFLLMKDGRTPIVLKDAESGRRLSIDTTEPAVVLYTGNDIGGSYSIRGTAAQDYLGLCLETQGAPDSVNHPRFTSAVLRAEERFHSETTYTFSYGE